jgi:sec-independent protein translocase protein TatB
MGGLGPGIGGGEYLVIAIVALLVVGPERLPMLLNKLGKMVGKAQRMANEFRSSFDEMARQSELDDLRKEVEALRHGQGMHALGPDAEAAFKDIQDDMNRPFEMAALPTPALDEWPDSPPVMAPLEPEPEPQPAAPKPRKPRARSATSKATTPKATAPKAKAVAKAASAKPRTRKKAAKA